MKRIFRRLLWEPLFHFFLIGALIFVVYLSLNDSNERPTDIIVITAERIEQLAAQHAATWNRSPTEVELAALIEDEVREEVYYRDALALGLDKNDAMVRRRLRQKMEFISSGSAALLEPPPGELESYVAANEKEYQHASRLAFEQIYLGTSPEQASVSRLLNSLRSSTAVDLAGIGERSFLPGQLELSSLAAVNGTFGADFYEQLEELAIGSWQGPVNSAYGVHLVRVLHSEPAVALPLSAIRERVLKDWRAEQGTALKEQDYANRRERFIVEIRRERE
jgi:hypothetical protein